MNTLALAGIALSASMWGCIPADAPPDDQQAEGTATQQLGSSGPFATEQDVINYWHNTDTTEATQIFLNGRLILDRLGFGPAIVDQYFECVSSNNNIYEVCPVATQSDLEGYSNFATLVSVCPSAAEIKKNNVLFRSGGPEVINITTCSGDQSLNGTIQYYKVTSDEGGFFFYESTCYP